MREELSRNSSRSITTLLRESAIVRRRSTIEYTRSGRVRREECRAECCTARVRKYVPCYHRYLYVQGYEQTRAAVYSKLPFMKLNFMVCGIRLYPIVESCRSMNSLSIPIAHFLLRLIGLASIIDHWVDQTSNWLRPLQHCILYIFYMESPYSN